MEDQLDLPGRVYAQSEAVFALHGEIGRIPFDVFREPVMGAQDRHAQLFDLPAQRML